MAVGSEMLTPFRVDTNSLIVTDRLNAIGYDVRLKMVVGDDIGELAAVFACALELGGCSSWSSAASVRPTTTSRGQAIARGAARCRSTCIERVVDADSGAVRPARPDDAGHQSASGDGAARRDAARESERHGAGAVDRARTTGDRRSAGSAARDDADDRSRRSAIGWRLAAAGAALVSAGAANYGPHGIRGRYARAADLRSVDDRPVPISTTILAVLGQIELHLTARVQQPR